MAEHDPRAEVRDFLASRRAKLTPDRVGLPSHGQRRVPGLRRSEVAQLAGVSVEYYTRLERGSLAGASDSVLEALARALQLDDAEREHLHDLARAANESGAQRRRRQSRTREAVRPSLGWLLEAMPTAPAFVRNGRLDVLAINELGRALYAPVYTAPTSAAAPVNLARYCFLDPTARELYPDWEATADVTVRLLRTELGRDPGNPAMAVLVGELTTRSDEFSSRWAEHDVRLHRAGTKHFRHPVVGHLELTFDALEVPGGTGLTLTAYTAEPGSPEHDKLRLLATWAATELRRPDLALDRSGSGAAAYEPDLGDDAG